MAKFISDIQVFKNITSEESITVGKDLTVNGNLTISGTTTIVDTETLSVADPVITLGGINAPTAIDGKDRGIEYRWHDGSNPKIGFFGYKSSESKFVFIPDATNTNEVFTGNVGTIKADLDGNAKTVTNGVYTNGSYSDPAWLTISKTKIGLSDVENTKLSTWTGSANITTIGAVTATSINKVSITAPANSATLTIADGKTFTVNNSITLKGVDGKTLDIGDGGGPLKSGAFADAYIHPSGDGNLHVPITGTGNGNKFLMAGSTAGSLSWGTPTNTTYLAGNGLTLSTTTFSLTTPGTLSASSSNNSSSSHTHSITTTDSGTGSTIVKTGSDGSVTAGNKFNLGEMASIFFNATTNTIDFAFSGAGGSVWSD